MAFMYGDAGCKSNRKERVVGGSAGLGVITDPQEESVPLTSFNDEKGMDHEGVLVWNQFLKSAEKK